MEWHLKHRAIAVSDITYLTICPALFLSSSLVLNLEASLES